MAKIPVYTQSSALGGIPNVVPFEPKQTGSMLQAAGQTLDNVAQDQLRQEQLLKQKQSQDGIAWSADALAQAKLDLNQKYLDMQQNAAPGAPNFRGDFEKQFDQYVFDASKKAPNPIGEQFFNRRMVEFKADMITQAMQFEAGARIEKRVTDISSSIDKARNLVSDNPAMFASSLGDITASIEGVGLPDKQRAALLQDATHGLSFSAVTAQINRNPGVALKQIQSGAWDNYLDPDNRISLERSAAAEVKAQEREALIAQQTDIRVRFDDAMYTAQMTGAQDMLSTRDILTAFPGAQGQKMVAQLRGAAQLGSDAKTILSQPLTADEVMLHALEPQAGPGVTEAAARYENAVKLVNQKHQALLNDGASYVAQNVGVVKQAWAAVPQDINDPNYFAASKAAADLSKQAQLDMGVPPEMVRVMPDSQASSLAKQVTATDPTKVGPILDGVVRTYGMSGLKELIKAGAPEEIKAIAFADHPIQTMWRQRLGEALKVKPSDLSQQVAAQNVAESLIDKAVSERYETLRRTFTDAAYSEIGGTYYNAMKRIAMFEVASGKDVPTAADDAWSAFDQHYEFAGTYRVPKSWNIHKVQAGLNGVIANINKLNIAAAHSGYESIEGDEPFRLQETLNSIQLGHYKWTTNAAEDGVILLYDNEQPVKHPDGSWLEIKFDDAAAGKYGYASPPYRRYPLQLGAH